MHPKTAFVFLRLSRSSTHFQYDSAILSIQLMAEVILYYPITYVSDPMIHDTIHEVKNTKVLPVDCSPFFSMIGIVRHTILLIIFLFQAVEAHCYYQYNATQYSGQESWPPPAERSAALPCAAQQKVRRGEGRRAALARRVAWQEAPSKLLLALIAPVWPTISRLCIVVSCLLSKGATVVLPTHQGRIIIVYPHD